jgi:hypothetical protein
LAFGTRGLLPLLHCGLFSLGPGVVVGELDADLAGVFALAVQRVPVVALSSARCDDGLQVRPALSNQLRFLVVVENGDLQAVVIRRVVHSEA